MNRLKRNAWIEFVLIFCWCVYLTKADSYFAPYLLFGMMGAYFCIVRVQNNRYDIRNENRSDRIVTYIYAVVLSAAVVLANYSLFSDLSDSRFMTCKNIVTAILLFLGGVVIFEEVLQGIVHLQAINGDTSKLKNKKLIFGILWGLLVLEYALVLFGAKYPGVLSLDSINQMTQLLEHSYSNHHPYYHTQIIHVLISIGFLLFGDINKAVALYSMFSIVVMASCFMYVVETIYESIKNIKVSLALFLFYLLMPFHIIYSITMWKDVFFGAAVTCFAVSCYRYLKGIGNSKLNVAVLLFAAAGMSLLRSNGWTAFLFSTVLFAVLFGKTQKKILLLLIMVLASTYIMKHPVLKMLHVSQPDTIEYLSIPAQQIARVVADGKELTEEQRQVLGQIIDLEKVPGKYKSFISDPVKDLVREKNNQNYIKEHAADLTKVYLQLGIKYPSEYIEAWVDQTRGYWNSGFSYWIWDTTVWENTLGIHQTVNCRFINWIVEVYLYVWQLSPILQIFLSIGIYVWGIVIASYCALIRRNREMLFITIPFIAVILTLMVSTPVFAEFRYAYAVFCGAPFVFAIVFGKNERIEITSDIQQ